jgi:hypothetical protein
MFVKYIKEPKIKEVLIENKIEEEIIDDINKLIQKYSIMPTTIDPIMQIKLIGISNIFVYDQSKFKVAIIKWLFNILFKALHNSIDMRRVPISLAKNTFLSFKASLKEGNKQDALISLVTFTKHYFFRNKDTYTSFAVLEKELSNFILENSNDPMLKHFIKVDKEILMVNFNTMKLKKVFILLGIIQPGDITYRTSSTSDI